MKIFNKITIFLILTCICSCSGFQARKVKLKDFPEIEKGDIKDLDLYYPKPTIKSIAIDGRFENLGIKQINKDQKNGCKIIAFIDTGNRFTTCPFITNYIAPFTLFTIPYYCATHYEAHASLHTQDENQTQNNINNQQNNQKYKTLKTYKLEDRVDEVWSSLLFLAAIPITPLRNINTPDQAKSQTYTRISEAITRQVLNDAKNFKECYKNEEDYYKYQKEKEVLKPKETLNN